MQQPQSAVNPSSGAQLQQQLQQQQQQQQLQQQQPRGSSGIVFTGGTTVGEYVLGSEIGHGSFATVSKGIVKRTGQSVAVKSVHRAKLTSSLLRNLESEISILKRMRHPNIVALLDCLKSRNRIHLVMEYCEVGDMAFYIKARKEYPALRAIQPTLSQPKIIIGGLKDPILRFHLGQLASAMSYLYSQKIIHRDIKPQNILLQAPSANYKLGESEQNGVYPNVKIADFGFSRTLQHAQMAETLCGSPLYMSPEVLRYEKYTNRVDLWSLGVVLYEMAVGKPPFRANNHIELLQKIDKTNDHILFPTKDGNTHGIVAKDLRVLIGGLLKKTPSDRMSFEAFFN
ncbi:kinase-like protein, partial [Ramicandelaber brevisporus]